MWEIIEIIISDKCRMLKYTYSNYNHLKFQKQKGSYIIHIKELSFVFDILNVESDRHNY